jgi:hypothetical protein
MPAVQKTLEDRAGFEPASIGFADQRVSLFATGPVQLDPKTKNPPRRLAGGLGFRTRFGVYSTAHTRSALQQQRHIAGWNAWFIES